MAQSGEAILAFAAREGEAADRNPACFGVEARKGPAAGKTKAVVSNARTSQVFGFCVAALIPLMYKGFCSQQSWEKVHFCTQLVAWLLSQR